MMSCMKTASPGAGIWFGKVALSACAFGSSLGWLLVRVTDLGTVVCWNGFLFFFFLLNGEQKYPMPVHCCPGFPEQEGVLAVPLHTLFLSLFSKEKES